MKKKIITSAVTTALLCQIAPLSIFAEEVKDLGEKHSIEQVKDDETNKKEEKGNQNNTEEKEKSTVKNSDKNMKNSTIIDIPDENFKAELNKILGEPEGNDITRDQLESIRSINIYSNKNIKSIEGIQYCTGLYGIGIYDNPISDISALGKLNAPDLSALTFKNGKINDISALGNINTPNLSNLCMDENEINDISALNNLNAPNLQYLSFKKNKINNLSLGNLNFNKLKTISLGGNEINDISSLGNLNAPNLNGLYLENNKISSIDCLANYNFPNLEYLRLSNNKISNISPLEHLNLAKIKNIEMDNNEICDISVISKINSPTLQVLSFSHNKIRDISPLNNIPSQKLSFIRLDNNEISDISPLANANLGRLFSLDISNQNFTYDKKVSKGKFFHIANPLKDVDGNVLVPTLDNDGTYITDNPDYPTGLMKWNNINKLAKEQNKKEYTANDCPIDLNNSDSVDVTYKFNKEFTAGAYDTKVTFNGTVHQPVTYYTGFKPEINAPDIIIRKGTHFDPMKGVTATDKVGELNDKGNLVDPNEKPKDITKDVKHNGTVNIYKPGTYTVTYEVTDSWGNTVTKERKVSVADTLTVEEIVGSDRYNTANKISDKWTRADNVVISNSDSIVDAMTASPFAYAKNAPVLLSSKSSLTPETKASIARLQAKTVYLIGGENSLDKNLEKEIKDMGVDVVRIAGNDRFETSLKIAKEVDNISDVSQVAVVNGQKGLPDAISISSPAAINNMPIILSNNAGDIPQGKDFIKSEDLSKAYVIGGNGTVSETLKNEVSDLIKNKPVTRLGGNDRIETNLSVLNEFYKSGALDNLFVVKDGAKREIDLVDSLSVSSLAAKEKSPVMIVGENLTTEQSEFIKKKEFNKLTRVGGNGNENAFNKIVKLVKNKIG